jgi:glycosyltransferase involved in cell wall biosynthesis
VNQQLTIVIPCLDDPALSDTLRSIVKTSDPTWPIRVIVVDDASKMPVCRSCLEKEFPRLNLTVIRNVERKGCAASRQLAAEFCVTDWIMFTDAHMRFTKGWYEWFCVAALEAKPKTLLCGTYISRQGSETYAPIGGSEFFFFRDQSFTGSGVRMMEHDPMSEPYPDTPETYEVPCAIGAAYFISRAWFNQLRGFEGLKGYGSDEPFLSIKTWLAGGSVRVMRDVRIEHICQHQGQPARERDSKTLMLYNKLWMLQLLFPAWMNDAIAIMPQVDPDTLQDAMFELHKFTTLQMDLEKHFKDLFVRTPEQFCQHFGVEAPCATLAMGTP